MSDEARITSSEMLNFIELKHFSKAWEDCNLGEDDLSTLQTMIMLRPDSAPVISGTGGLRKLRFSGARSNQGKSGSVRVAYCHFADYALVLLVTAYPKSRKDDLSPAEKRAIADLLVETELSLPSLLITGPSVPTTTTKTILNLERSHVPR